MGPVFPPAPRSPALVLSDLGDRHTRESFPTASFGPCGSTFGIFSCSVVREGPAFIAWFPCWRPVPSGGWFRSCDLSLPPGGSVTATPPCRSGPSVLLLAEAFRFPSALSDRW